MAGVQRLVVARRVRIGHEHGWSPRGRELPDRAPRSGDGEIGRRERRAELARRRNQHVVVPVDLRPEALVVALAGHVQHGRPRVAVRLDGEVVQAARAGERAEEREHGTALGQAEATTALVLGDATMLGRDRPAGDAVLGSVAAGDLVGEKDAPRERRREPVRQPEMCIGFRQRRGDLPPPRRIDHRPGHVATAAQNDVRPAALQDRRAGARRAAGLEQRAEERNRRSAREAGDLEGVELVARLGDEPSLDAIRRPGERHRDAAFPKRCCDRERREHVTGCSAGRDQAPQIPSLIVIAAHAHR